MVYPAASLIQYFQGKKLVVINKTSIPQDNKQTLVIEGKIGEVFSQLRVGQKSVIIKFDFVVPPPHYLVEADEIKVDHSTIRLADQQFQDYSHLTSLPQASIR